MAGPYKLTVYAALPGTPLLDDYGRPTGRTSVAGHMWYDVSDGSGHVNSYGFAPKEHGAMSGPGKGYDTDTASYQNPRYSRTLEINEAQYAKLNEFGMAALKENWRYFKGDYNGLTNSCVDFTWSALKHAGMEIHRPEIRSRDGAVVLNPEHKGAIETRFEGRAAPGHNKVDMQQIVAPIPGSPYNHWHENPPPSQATFLQQLISENDAATPEQQAHAQRFKDQLGHKLSQYGMSGDQIETLASAAAKEATRYAGQGEVGQFLLSRDGNTVAMRQEFPPLREFSVSDALKQSPVEHWREAAAMRSSMQDSVSVSLTPSPQVRPEAVMARG